MRDVSSNLLTDNSFFTLFHPKILPKSNYFIFSLLIDISYKEIIFHNIELYYMIQ